MPQNTNAKSAVNRPRVINDFAAPKPKKPPVAFPAVGMTLSSYNHDPFEKMRQQQAVNDKPSRWQRLRRGVTLKRAALTLVLLVVLAGGWVGWKFIYNAHRLFGGSVFGIFSTTKLKGEDSGRVNILLAGNSADDPGHQGGNLTDSIMILSIDTKDNTGFMLSIPRDLYVAIPGNGHQKINAAYPDGNADHFQENGYPDGGMGQLEKIIHDDFGITTDYYALINYNAIKQAVDDVGGITINIQSSDPRGLYDPDIDYATHPHQPLVKLSNGEHTLNGEQALDLARARGDAYGSYGFAGSDFTRTANQRAMLLALKSKATSAGVLANPVKLGGLFDAIGGNVKTDLNLSEVHRLYDITKNISGNNIQSIALNNANGQNLLMNYTAYDGESALAPAAGLDDYSDIQQYLQQLMSNNPIVREGATVVVLNGTSTSGLASKQEAKLQNDNIQVSAVGDADNQSVTSSQIIDNSGGKMPATLALLKSIYGSDHVTTTNPYNGRYNANFIVIVGSDQLSAGGNNNSN